MLLFTKLPSTVRAEGAVTTPEEVAMVKKTEVEALLRKVLAPVLVAKMLGRLFVPIRLPERD